MGAAMANPSVVLWIAKPTIRKAPSAASPSTIAAPIARPSPKLCKPIPIAIIKAIAIGPASFDAPARSLSFSPA